MMMQSLNRDSTTAPMRVYIVLCFGILSISFAPILVRLAQGEGLPSLVIAASRLMLAALLITPTVLQRYRHHITSLARRDWMLILASGAVLAIHFASWVTSLEYTSVLISVVFVTSSPLWVAILEFIFLRTRLSRMVLFGLVIALAGGLLIGFAGQFTGDTNITINQQREFIGGALSLIGAIAFAIYLLIGRSIQQTDGARRKEKLPILAYLWLVYGSAGLILLVWIAVARIPLTGYSANGYLWLVLMAVFPQLIGHSSLNYAVAYLPATLVSMITQLEPIGSAILAYLLFDELPLPLQILGSVTILFGVMLANFGQLRRKTKSEPS